MINRFLARFERPERGWDPISQKYAEQYATSEWTIGANEALLDELDGWVGGLAGKRVLDLGGGPGQYAVAFARRGANVTWHDVSRSYMAIAKRKAREHGVDDRIEFSLGYLDDAAKMLGPQFDLVFNRICWRYSFSDRSFADVVNRLIRPGGFAYIDSNHAGDARDRPTGFGRVRPWLNEALGIKVGHPNPPQGRIERLFRRYRGGQIRLDTRAPQSDRIWFQKGT